MITQVKKISLLLLLFLFVGGSFTSIGIESHAEENGGVVKTNGVVGFYEDSSSSEATVNSSTSAKVTKPTGRYPSTGELVKKSLSITGLILLLLILLFFLFKRKKEHDKGGEA